MISICIPIYNFDVNKLVVELSRQIEMLPVKPEILLIDDASSESFKAINRETCQKHCYVELVQNVGRAAIRNLFLNYAKYDYLLFLDCDSVVIQDDFIAAYLVAIKELHPMVVCGGRVYDEELPDRNHRLRWKFGIERESQSSDTRMLNPNKSFMTNNFIVKRSLLESVKFDDRLKDYGHEDTLFGFELKKRKIVITHINNPVLNGDVEENALFFEKTEYGIANLAKILRIVNYNTYFVEDVKILAFHRMMKKWSLSMLILWMFWWLRRPIKWLLIKGYVYLPLFDFYKLGLLIQKENSRTAQNE
ncbi:MAG: glycosyltransferase family 2 protein [Bacteroidales bacterium]